jgi:hypothetical protein
MTISFYTDLLEKLDTSDLPDRLRACLARSLNACWEGDTAIMVQVARKCIQIAVEEINPKGIATAETHYGVGLATSKDFEAARTTLARSRQRFYQNWTDAYLRGRGIASGALGLVCEDNRASVVRQLGSVEAAKASYFIECKSSLDKAIDHLAQKNAKEEIKALKKLRARSEKWIEGTPLPENTAAVLRWLDTKTISSPEQEKQRNYAAAGAARNTTEMHRYAIEWIELADRRSDSASRAAAMIHQAYAYLEEKQYEKASELCENALLTYKRSPRWPQVRECAVAAYAAGYIRAQQSDALTDQSNDARREALTALDESSRTLESLCDQYNDLAALCDKIKRKLDEIIK